jgi:hypothetical protein
MSDTIIVALIGLGGSALGSFIGVLVNTKLTNYRIEQLEKKQDKYNNLIERTFHLEEAQALTENRMKVQEHRMEDAENNIEKVNDRITNMTRRNGI